MQDQVNEKVVAVSIKTTKLTASVLQAAIKQVLAKMKAQKGKQPRGKQTRTCGKISAGNIILIGDRFHVFILFIHKN